MGGYKTSCPVCPSSDAFHLYDDGHGHCFSCGYHQYSDNIRQLEEISRKNMNIPIDENAEQIYLPGDAKKTIDAVALQWLDKYGITRQEIIDNDIRWSATRRWLIFPVRDEQGLLIFFWARTFNPNDPKWQGRGNKAKHPHVIGLTENKNNAIIVVEDIVSTIKVARHAPAMCLFGSTLHQKQLMFLRFLTNKANVWLDHDKYAEAIEMSKRMEMVGIDTNVIYTEKDPKDHSDEQIVNLVSI